MAGHVVYFISDTHLGDGTGADLFRYNNQLIDLLLRIESDPRAELVLLGDFMELWSGNLESVLIHHTEVFDAIARIASSHAVNYVVGNHDCIPWYYFIGQRAGNISITERFNLKRANLVAVHGHQFDPTNKVSFENGAVKPPWTRKLVEVVGVVERIGGPEAGEVISNVGDVLNRAIDVLQRQSPGERGYPAGEGIYEEAAHNFMREGARYVVMGHTHHPLVHRYGNRMYVNTGSWVWERYPPTYARLEGSTLQLLEANTHQPYEKTN